MLICGIANLLLVLKNQVSFKKIFYLKYFITNYSGKLFIHSYLGEIAVSSMSGVLNIENIYQRECEDVYFPSFTRMVIVPSLSVR